MADIYKIILPNGNEYLLKDEYVRSIITELDGEITDLKNALDTVNAPTVDSSLSLEDGGYIQCGALVFLDAIVSVTTGSSDLSDAVSGLPNPANGTPVFTLTEAPYQPLKKYEFNATITSGGVLTAGPAGRYGWCYSVIPGSTITVKKGALYGLYAVDPVPNQTVAADSTRHVGALNNTQITIPSGVYYIVICSDTGEPYVRVPVTADIKLRISGSSADILGALTQGQLYHIYGFYFKDKEIVQ